MDNNNPNLNIKDLIPGEIYLYNYRFIARYPTGPSLNIHNQSFVTHEKWKWSLNIQEVTSLNIQEVTPEQRDWYAACVKANKFIPKEEALKKTKFEVGRWYKCDNPNYIGKFEKFEKFGNKFWTTEWINHGKYIKNINNNQSWVACTKIREIPLEEIQQYLPEGHPDKFKIGNKIPKVGDYVITKGYSRNYDGKVLKITRIYKGFGDNYYCNFTPSNCSTDNFRIDSITRYVDQKNIDNRNYTDEELSEFKLSDKWYVIVTNNNQFNLILNYLIKKGYLNKNHTNYTPYKYPFRIGKESKKEGYYDDSIEIGQKITFEQFKKYILKKDNYNHFKIGDIVEYIGTETNLSNDTKKDDLQLGYNYIVKSISKNNIELHGKLFYHDMNLFKLATNKEFPLIDHPDWKIGDRVEIIDKGKQYSIYSEAFKKLNFKNKKQNRCDNGYKGKIFHVCFHPTQNKTLIAINLNNGGQCLIGYKGIKKIDTSSNKVIEIVDDVPTFKSKEKHTTKPIQTQKLKAILIK